ncbi:DUF5651 domain-containing protein [Romboutsia sp. Marseille-P6047]|uniref:DUF5651 domain-containing protein n=1 Tax=Romboutsia sp. Marseille-P6047 TaxID=2161817 RepID=UPI000F04E723|nr:DUF5651 domain-containing protein [Romboutsia sp. Marseille-P6047]
MKKYLNSNEMLDILFVYHLADTSEKIVESWTSRSNMTKNEAKYLRTSITYAQKFLTGVRDRLDNKEQEKLSKRTIKASEKPIIFVDEWMKQRVMGTYEKELEIVKIGRSKFKKVALLAMKAVCEDCTDSFATCSLYDIFEDCLMPRADREKNCPYCFLSKEKEEQRQENLKRLEEEKRLRAEQKSKRKQRKQKNRYDEEDEIIEYNFKTRR